MKKIFRQYVFTVMFILCIMAFFAGIITVKEKTQYNMDMSPYSTVEVVRSGNGITITVGEKEAVIMREDIEKLGRTAFYSALGDVFVRLGNFFRENGG